MTEIEQRDEPENEYETEDLELRAPDAEDVKGGSDGNGGLIANNLDR